MFFQVHYFDNISFSYPYEMGDRVAIVPKPTKIPFHRYLFFIFNYSTWILFLSAIIVLGALYFFISYAYGLNLDYFIMVWSPLVNVEIPRHLINKTKQKWLLVIWIFSSLVLGVSFQTSLTQSFVKPRYETSIKTIEDLRNSQMKIYIHPHFAVNILESLGLTKNIVYMEAPETIQRIKERNTSGAFVASRQLANYYINENKRNWGDPIYEIVEEVLIPGNRVYLFQKVSPFWYKINKCLLLIQQHALHTRIQYNAIISPEKNILQLSHVLVIFYMLFIGCLAGFIAFLMENYRYLMPTGKRHI